MSQSRRRPPPRRPAQKRRATATTNKSQRLFAIFGIVIVFVLIASIVGPPLVDYLTQPDDEPDIIVDQNVEDPVEQDFLARIESDPNDASAMAGLGSYLGQIGRIDEAIGWYERALALEPDNMTIRLGFGQALANGQKRPDAEIQLMRVIEAEPNNEQAHFSLAQLYASWVPARTAEAIAEYQTVIAIAPDTFVASRSQEELAELNATPVAAGQIESPVVEQ